MFISLLATCVRWGLTIGVACGASTGTVIGVQDGLDDGSWGFGLVLPAALVGAIVGASAALLPSLLGGAWIARSLRATRLHRQDEFDASHEAARLLRLVVVTVDVLVVVPAGVGVAFAGDTESRLITLASVAICNLVAFSLISRPASAIGKTLAR